MRYAALGALALAAAVFAPPPAGGVQEQRPVFRSAVTYVEVEVTVTGKDGRPIDDLRREDFSLLDDGTPQTIASFARVDIPIEAPSTTVSRPNAPVVADSLSNVAVSGRVFALVLDGRQTEFRESHRVIDAATRFVEQYAGAGDLVAVVATGGSVAQSFTTEKAFALRAIGRFRGDRGASAAEAGAADVTFNLDATEPWMKALALSPDAVIKKNDDCMGVMQTMSTLTAVAEYMGRIPQRRRSIVLFGSGIRPASACDDRDNRLVQQAIDEINSDGVTLYGVDVRGLPEAGTPLGIASFGAEPSGPGWASVEHGEVRSEQDTVRYLANETGGFAAVNRNDLGPAFARVMRENSRYYLLGFSPASDRRDGSFHDIDVKVSRPDVEVRARKGYVAARNSGAAGAAGATTSAALSDALASPFPVSDIPIHASVALLRGDKKHTALSMTIEIDASRFAFRAVDGRQTDALEVAFYSARRGKAAIDAHEMLQLSLAGNFAEVREHGLRLGQRLALPPGHHRLLVGLREVNAGLIGTLPFELDVPDFSKAAPSMSSIVLTSAASAAVQTTHADASLKDVLPAPPTARRTFSRDDTLAVFAEVYGAAARLAGMEITATVDRADGTHAADVETASPVHRRDAGLAYTGRLRLRALEPGRYRLVVRGISQGATPIVRSTPFDVR
jgi:VWFA-related protein